MPLHTPLNPVPALSPPEIQRALGTVLGAAVGDALGAPFEFGPAGAWSARFAQPQHGALTEMVGGGPFGWGPGEFTDDTQMALALALALQAAGGYDPTWCGSTGAPGPGTRRTWASSRGGRWTSPTGARSSTPTPNAPRPTAR